MGGFSIPLKRHFTDTKIFMEKKILLNRGKFTLSLVDCETFVITDILFMVNVIKPYYILSILKFINIISLNQNIECYLKVIWT